MQRRMLVWLTVIVLGALLLPVTTVTAASEQPDDGVVIWSEDYILAEDEELDGDLVVFNGDATLEPGSRVRGDVVVWNGNADVDGIVEGNLVASNGDVRLDENAHVQGDVVCTWNCDIEQDEGARVDGELIEGPSLRGIPFGQLGEPGLQIEAPSFDPEPFWLSGPEQLLRWIFRVVRRVVTVLVIAAIGGVVALIWPRETAQVGDVAFESPGASLGVGFLTIIAALALILALAITICLSPAAALVALALSAAGLFGWIAIGARVGERLLQALKATGDKRAQLDHDPAAPLWSAGLGTLIITLITVGLSTAFCLSPLGWLLTFVIGCFGIGAVVLTRFGTTPYVPGDAVYPRQPRKPVPSPVEASVAPTSPPPSEQPTEPAVEEGEKDLASEDDQDAGAQATPTVDS